MAAADAKNDRMTDSRPVHTEREILQIFQKFGLADPEIRRYFQNLGQFPLPADDAPCYWSELYSGTNFDRSRRNPLQPS